MYIASYFIGALSILLGIYFFRDFIKLQNKNEEDKKIVYLDEGKARRISILEYIVNIIILIFGGIFMIIFCAPQVIFLQIILIVLFSVVLSNIRKKYIKSE